MIKNTFHNSESKPGATEEDGGSYQLGLLKRGVKRSVYLPVNQLLNPLTWPTVSCVIRLLLHFQSACSFLFALSPNNQMQSSIVWCVAGASQFHKAQQVSVIILKANFGIKIMWAPSIALCTRCSATVVTNSLGREVTDTKSVSPIFIYRAVFNHLT